MLKVFSLSSMVLTFLLLLLGGIVTSTGSGLGCGPDWPLCHGQLIPSFSEPQVFIEWLHRLVAAFVGIFVLATAIVAWRQAHNLPSVSALAGIAVVLLLTQVILGAITVRLELPKEVATAHLATGTILFAVLIMMATLAFQHGKAPQPFIAKNPLTLVWLAAGFTFAQMVLGAYVRHNGAGLACSDAILCLPVGQPLVLVQMLHRLMALVVLVFVHASGDRTLRATQDPTLRKSALAAMILVLVQIALGVVSVTTQLSTHATTAHLGVALALLGALIFMATRLALWGRAPVMTPMKVAG
ncbi:MAG: hypothetical protein A2Z21_03175 [Candidatus Fraserbacteria bacterium RBG_16_55_9]|uniref:Cytochrome oxidase assembly protein n=1 Tax=Fraserbacteria sp. (strain RBG_16_55_9) TaxID=1817864 RepID=A0A1F5V187_FRAXR|nr:MAG: hypothetical protein A2Z21_03175 [Candidatus Fraserbacteria bacterium RBG_16_55_9]